MKRKLGMTMSFKYLTPEQKEKAKTAKTPEDILALAKEEGYELSIEELDAVSGGWGGEDPCPSYAGCDDLS